MPEGARILRFPDRQSASALSEDANERALAYLATSFDGRPIEDTKALLSDSDSILAFCQILRARCDSIPNEIAREAVFAHGWISSNAAGIGVFDERDYFLGELALVAANAFRQIGRLGDADRWIDKAEAGFRHTVNPAPLLATAAFVRIAVRYAGANFQDVLEVLPSLIKSFERFGMHRELAKSRFLEAAVLKESGRMDEAIAVLEHLRRSAIVNAEPSFLGRVLVALGHNSIAQGDFAKGIKSYGEALPVLRSAGLFGVVAEIKWGVADAYRAQRLNQRAISAYREALNDYADLGLIGTVSVLRLALAELLLEAGFHREAEKEILTALPTFNAENMAPAAAAAVVLLSDSVRQRKTDPKALGELRQLLQAKN